MPYELHSAKEALELCPPVSWLIDELIPETGLVMLHGDPGAMKTWTMLHISTCIASGIPWLDRNVKQGSVLYVDEELGNTLISQKIASVVRGLKVPHEIPFKYMTMEGVLFGGSAEAERHYKELSLVLEKEPFKLMLIDSFSVVSEGSENNVEDVRLTMKMLRKLSNRYNLLIMFCHHNNREGDFRGSGHIKAASNLVIRMDKKSKNICFTVTKSWHGEFWTLLAIPSWETNPERFILRNGGKGTAQYPKTQQEILDLLASGPRFKVDLTKGDKVGDKAAETLIRLGIVERVDDGGRGSKAMLALSPNGSCEVAKSCEIENFATS